MRLVNSTPYSARLFRGVIDEKIIFGSLAARVTFDIVDGALRPAAEQSWKVSPGPWMGPYGPMDGDDLPLREGVDVMVFGSARPPGGRPVTRLDVEVEVGPEFRGHVIVWGDRVWERRGGRLVPGEPEPFRAIPLTVALAFGGFDVWDELPIAFQDNPLGRGYYLDEERAEGKPLPNIEHPDAPIRVWNDQPEPVGTCQCSRFFGPRLRRVVEVDEETVAIRAVRPALYNEAFPGMIAPAARPGDRVTIRGVREDGPISFTLPDIGLRARLRFGDLAGERSLPIDQIGVEADHRRVFVSYRYPFRYDLVPRQRRRCELVVVEL